MVDPERYSIDELAAASGIPSRTIRFYQSAGALPRPVIRGRVARYGDVHLERLKLITDLQDRGLRIKAIRDLLAKVERGELALNDWLGLDAQIGAPWSDDRPRLLDEEAFYQLLGERRPGLVANLLRLRLVDKKGESFFVRSPALLRVSMQLLRSGVDLDTSYEGAAIIRKHAARVAKDLAAYFLKRASEGFGREASADELIEAFRAMRPLGQEALVLIFDQEMDRVVWEQKEAGKTVALPRRAPKKRRKKT